MQHLFQAHTDQNDIEAMNHRISSTNTSQCYQISVTFKVANATLVSQVLSNIHSVERWGFKFDKKGGNGSLGPAKQNILHHFNMLIMHIFFHEFSATYLTSAVTRERERCRRSPCWACCRCCCCRWSRSPPPPPPTVHPGYVIVVCLAMTPRG